MTRTVKQLPTAIAGEYKWEVTISEQADFPKGSIGARNALNRLLRTCIDTPGLLVCGGNAPSSLRATHDGMEWVIILDAVGP
jgi:hypothetical protein